MKNIPLVSIIMPLYNKRPYVKYAIESVRKQTFTDWELIIVDDGSTDGSSEEVPQYDPRIRLFHQENKGPGAARNMGIKMASGKVITFLDADDYYYPHKIEKEVHLLWREQRAEWIVSALECNRGDNLRLKRIKDIKGNEIKGEPVVFSNALRELMIKGWHIDGLCLKKSLLEQIGGFNEDMRCFEIAEFVMRCALKSPKVVICPEPLYRVVKVPDSAFKISDCRIKGQQQQGESLYRLSKEYPEFSEELITKSRESLHGYITALIRIGKSKEARRYLLHSYPYPRYWKWWKMWIGSWMPKGLLRMFMNINDKE